MSALLSPDAMEAGWIDSDQGRLFACYHPPRAGRRRACAVLMCDPFGSDRMNLHPSYRALALRLADAGFATLRVDYPGTCDSSGHPRDPDLLGAWFASLHTAADWLARRSGTAELVLFGALLGGTLAVEVARARRDVVGLALWGALPSGRAFLREATAMRAMQRSNPRRRRPSGWQDGDEELVGFLVPRALAEQLAAIDLLARPAPSVRAAAVFARGRADRGEALARALRESGATVYAPRTPPVEIARLVDQAARPPEALLDEIAAWVGTAFPGPASAPAPRPDPPRLRDEIELDTRSGARVREQVVRFGSDLGLIAIVTHPPAGRRALERAIVLVNGGANHRAGINRNHTEWARAWAELGFRVMRLDLRGLGDSVPLRPEHVCALHRPESVLDIRAAMDFLERHAGARGFVCAGLCAGAYQSFRTALADPRVEGLVLLNPLRFHGVRVRRLLALQRARDLPRAALDVARRFSGDARVRARAWAARLRGRPAPAATWLADAFLQLTARGCDVLVVFNAGETMAGTVQEQLRADRARLQVSGRFALELVDASDHIFSPLWSQERVGEILTATLARWAKRARSEH